MTTTSVEAVEPERVGWHARREVVRWVVWALLFLALVLFIVPLLWALLGSFKSEVEYREIPVHIWPRQWTLEAYTAVIAQTNLVRGYINSVIVSSVEIVFVVVISSLAGYVFSQKQFWGKNALFLFVLATTMIPFTMLLIPLYLTFVRLGIQDTYAGIVLPSLISPYGIFLCRQFVGGIPRDLFDAAAVDGASDLSIYRNVVLPLCRPVLIALAILTLIGSFNDLLWPLVIVRSSELETLPLVLARITLIGERMIWTQFLAAVMLGSAPLVAVFLVLHRGFMRGIALTGIVG